MSTTALCLKADIINNYYNVEIAIHYYATTVLVDIYIVELNLAGVHQVNGFPTAVLLKSNSGLVL